MIRLALDNLMVDEMWIPCLFIGNQKTDDLPNTTFSSDKEHSWSVAHH